MSNKNPLTQAGQTEHRYCLKSEGTTATAVVNPLPPLLGLGQFRRLAVAVHQTHKTAVEKSYLLEWDERGSFGVHQSRGIIGTIITINDLMVLDKKLIMMNDARGSS